MTPTRRELLKATGAAAIAPAGRSLPRTSASADWPPDETGAPRICLGIRADADAALMRRVKQIGVNYVLMGGPPIPWTEAELRERMNRFQADGLTILNMMIAGFPKTGIAQNLHWSGSK